MVFQTKAFALKGENGLVWASSGLENTVSMGALRILL